MPCLVERLKNRKVVSNSVSNCNDKKIQTLKHNLKQKKVHWNFRIEQFKAKIAQK